MEKEPENTDLTWRGKPRINRPKGTAGDVVQMNVRLPAKLAKEFALTLAETKRPNQSLAFAEAITDFIEKYRKNNDLAL